MAACRDAHPRTSAGQDLALGAQLRLPTGILLRSALRLAAAAGSIVVAVSPAAAAPGPVVRPHPVGGVVISGNRVSAASTIGVGTYDMLPDSATLAANMP